MTVRDLIAALAEQNLDAEVYYYWESLFIRSRDDDVSSGEDAAESGWGSKAPDGSVVIFVDQLV